MICPDCHGMGWIRLPRPTLTVNHLGKLVVTTGLPCQRCHGSGVAYCCDGEDMPLSHGGGTTGKPG